MSAAFPCTPILDNANRPNEGPPPSANYTTPAGFDGMVVDTLQFAIDPAAVGLAVAMWNTATGANCEVFVYVPVLPDDGDSALLFARTLINLPFSSGYMLSLTRDDAGGDFLELTSNVGAAPVISSTSVVFDAGDGFGMRLCTSQIETWHYKVATGWVLKATVTDYDTLTGGYIGMAPGLDFTVRLVNFGGGDADDECCGIVPPTPPPYPALPPTGPSFYQQTGLSIIATDPLLAVNRSTAFSRLSDQIQTFHMEKRAVGGYWSAQANVNMRSDEVEDWIERGLGRHVQVVDEALCQVWEGFVNRIEAKLGKLTFTLGPLLDIGNQVAYVYSTVDNTTTPPTMGARAKTAYADDLDSQAAYGIIQKVQSEGGSTAALATQNRDTFIAEHAWPPTGRRSTLLGGSPGDLTIEMLGYWAWLTVYVYNQTQLTGEIDVDVKMRAILDACPNYPNLFSIDYARITPNSVHVAQYENDDRTAEDLILGLNALGDAANGRMNIGFYNGRQIIYEPAPTSIRYVQRVLGNDLLTDLIGGNVRPWSVMPGEWIFYADFLSGRLPPVTQAGMKRDPRCGYIETVTLDNLYGLDINGIHVGTLDQMLAKQGLAGEGA